MDAAEIIAELHSLGNQANREGMARFGIKIEQALGISVTSLRQIARRVGRKDHALAQELWDTGLHEARILATIVDDPRAVTGEQMERWVAEFDSWDLCDQCCGNLFDKTSMAWDKAVEWSAREREYEKRAGFALIAYLAVHDKKAPDEKYLLIPRNYQARGRRQQELRQESGQLGLARDRQAQRSAQPGRD